MKRAIKNENKNKSKNQNISTSRRMSRAEINADKRTENKLKNFEKRSTITKLYEKIDSRSIPDEKTLKKRKRNKKLIFIFRTISLVIIIFCSLRLYNWTQENKANKEIIDNIRSQVAFVDSNNNIAVDITSNNDNNSTELEVTPKASLDFSALTSQNSDTVAWIKVNNTDVDFPVVKTTDNDYYIKHNFYKEYNSAGWIFADYRNKFDGTDKNIIIYGHNRRDGSMFSTLNNILDESWYTNSDNKIVTLYTPEKTLKYEIFSVYKIKATNFENTTDFQTDEEFQNYIDACKNRSIYDFNQTATASDKILTVYTCANNNAYRIILQAKLLTE